MFNNNMKGLPGAVCCSPPSLLKRPTVPSSGQYVTCWVFFNKEESLFFFKHPFQDGRTTKRFPYSYDPPTPLILDIPMLPPWEHFFCWRRRLEAQSLISGGGDCCFPSLLGSCCCRCGLQAIDSAVEAPSMNKACCLRR